MNHILSTSGWVYVHIYIYIYSYSCVYYTGPHGLGPQTKGFESAMERRTAEMAGVEGNSPVLTLVEVGLPTKRGVILSGRVWILGIDEHIHVVYMYMYIHREREREHFSA